MRLCCRQSLNGPLAQSVEQRAFNPLVLRSNRRRPIKICENPRKQDFFPYVILDLIGAALILKIRKFLTRGYIHANG